MELLKLNRKTLQMLGLCSLADGSGFVSKIGQVTIVLAVIVSLSFFTANSFLFFWRNYPPFDHCILAVAQIVSLLQAGISFISLLFHARNVRNFFNQIQSVFDQCESAEIILTYLRVNRFCENFIKWTMRASIGLFLSGMAFMAAAGALFYHLRDGQVETENLFLPWQLELPIDSNTNAGYFYVLMLQMIMVWTYFIVAVPIESLSLSMGLFMGAFHSHFKLLLQDISELIDSGVSGSECRIRIGLKTRLIKAINLHNRAKTVFALCSETLSGTIFAQVILAALIIAGTASAIEAAIKSTDLQAFSSLIGTCAGISNIFLFCFIGTFATDQFSLYTWTTYDSNWYRMPIELQPYIRLMISNAQRTCSFIGLGIFDLNLALFTRIMRASMSYLLMFKKL